MINYNKWFVIFLIIVLIISAIELAYSLYRYSNLVKSINTVYQSKYIFNIFRIGKDIKESDEEAWGFLSLLKTCFLIFLNFVSVFVCIGMLVSILKYDYSFSRNVIYGAGIVLFLSTFLNLIMLSLQIGQRIKNKKKNQKKKKNEK